MSSDSIKNPCSPSCPKVRENLRTAIKELPNVTDGIFPRKKNDVEPRLPSDVISRDVLDERVIKAADDHEIPIDHDVRIEKLKDVEAKPIDSEKYPIIQKPTIIPPEEIIEKKIHLIEEEKLIEKPTVVQKEIVPSTEKSDDREEERNDFIKEKELIQEPIIIPKEAVTPIEKTVDRAEEKIDSITKKKLDQELVTVQEKIPTETVPGRVDEKIEEKDLDVERVTVEPIKKIPIEKPEIIEDEVEQTPITEIKLELSRELEKHFEPKEGEEEEESITDGRTEYEQFIDEELQESLPALIAREIPEEPRAVRREISRNAATLYKKIDRERPVRPPSEREAVTAMPEERPVREEVSARRALEYSTITERIVSHKPAVAEDVCEETCPLVKEQKERIMRKLKVQQVVDHYYLTKGFSYFEDVCTCSLTCMMYTLSRDPFVKSIFASLAVFAIGLKLCSELDAWEMPSRVS